MHEPYVILGQDGDALKATDAAWLAELASDEARRYGAYHLRECEEWKDGALRRDRVTWMAVHVKTGTRAGGHAPVVEGRTYAETSAKMKAVLEQWIDANG